MMKCEKLLPYFAQDRPNAIPSSSAEKEERIFSSLMILPFGEVGDERPQPSYDSSTAHKCDTVKHEGDELNCAVVWNLIDYH